MKKSANTIKNKIYPLAVILLVVALWQAVSSFGLVESFLLPPPVAVAKAMYNSAPELAGHLGTSLTEAAIGLAASVILAFALAIIMESFSGLYKAVYPLLIITQTIPVIAIAPLLVLWMGYGIAPKIVLIVIVCFFPVAVGLLNGFKDADPEAVELLKAMGATPWQIFRHIKLPYSMTGFFAGFKIAATYSVVGAVIAEWLGGDSGLGVYMSRVRKSYAFDKMFAVIIIITVISLLLIYLVSVAEKRALPYKYIRKEEND